MHSDIDVGSLLVYLELSIELTIEESRLRMDPYRKPRKEYEYSYPWTPRQVREPRREPAASVKKNEAIWVKEFPNSAPSSRPTSRASSTRSTTEADLLEKAAKLLQDVEEIERKPIVNEPVIIDPRGNPKPVSSAPKSPADFRTGSSGVQTAIIKVPSREVDNKSPLPFSYDNFSTLGVRGNIASVGAAEPESPYPPIFPTIKKSPSPIPRGRNI